MSSKSLYLHIPFCRQKCSYCDFNTYAGINELISAYVAALCREAGFLQESAGQRMPVHTIFLGGGTPSLLTEAQLDYLLMAVEKAFEIKPGAEITLEANPGTVSKSFLRGIRRLGINRISLGMQSARPEALKLLEREHAFPDVINSVAWARQAGFTNLSLDLIFGLPYQSLEAWQASLEHGLALAPDHFSLYALSLEHGTPLRSWVDRGLVEASDPDLAAEMYEWAAVRLEEAGYGQYEISNWARVLADGDLEVCNHNLQYWRNLPYIGLGAGAHGFLDGYRTANVLAPQDYIQRIQQGRPQNYPRTPATADLRPIDRFTEMQETMLMGFRLTREGISRAGFSERFGIPPEEIFAVELDELNQTGLITWEGEEALRLTPRGRLLGNQVFIRFV
jgi:oxygen-independent coproporphyrinogen-3 oxidase